MSSSNNDKSSRDGNGNGNLGSKEDNVAWENSQEHNLECGLSPPFHHPTSSSPYVNDRSSKPPLYSAPTQHFKNNNEEEQTTVEPSIATGVEQERGASIFRMKSSSVEKVKSHSRSNSTKVSFLSSKDPPPRSNDDRISQDLSDITTTSGSLKGPPSDPRMMEYPKNYSLNDLLESTKEGPDEAAVLSTIERNMSESRERHNNATQGNMLPRIPDELLLHLREQEAIRQKQDTIDRKSAEDLNDPNLMSRQKDVLYGDGDDLRILSRRLAEFTESCEIPKPVARNRSISHGDDLRRNKINEMEENNNNGNEDDDDSGINLTLRLTKAGVDRYYNNAALIFPTKRTRSGSGRMSDPAAIDAESAAVSHDADDRIDDDDPSSKQKKSRMNLVQRMQKARKKTKLHFDVFVDFMEPHKRTIWKTFWQVTVGVMAETKRVVQYCYCLGLCLSHFSEQWFIMVPSVMLAGALFYGFDNPPTGYALSRCSDLNMTMPSRSFSLFREQDDRNLVNSTVATLSPAIDDATYASTMSQDASNDESTNEPTYSIFDRETPLCIDEELSLKEASVSWWFLFLGW
jgi:hypothetical protein